MRLTLKGKLVEWEVGGEKMTPLKDYPQIGTIELEPGEIKVGSEALIKVKVTRSLSAQDDFMAVDGYGDEKAYLESDVVAVLPKQEPEKRKCSYCGQYICGCLANMNMDKKEIEPLPFRASWDELCLAVDKLIKVVNEMRKK